MYLIIFQLPKNSQSLKLRVNRMLTRIKARMLQRSVWLHENAQKLVEIASFIKSRGGKAIVLEKNVVYE